MTKRATSLLFTLLVFIFNTTMVWGVPLTSKTTFDPQSDVTSSTYMLDEIEIEPPFIRAIRTSYTYTTSLPDNNNSARFNKYQVTSEGAKFGYGATNNDTQKNTFMTVDYENLQTNKQYKLTVTMRLVGDADMEVNVTKNWSNLAHSGCGQPGNNNERVKITSGNCDATFTFTFQPTSPMGSFSFGWNYADKSNLKYVLVKSVSISGDVEKQVLSSKGFEVCAGETTRLTAVGLTAPVTWEECNQGETTWTTIEEETGTTMDVVVTKAKHYRAKKGSDILYTQKTTSSGTVENIAIRPVICCAKAGDLIPIFTESFDLENDNIIKLMSANRAKFQDDVEDDITDYSYASGTFPPDSYAILKVPSQGGHWTSSHITGGNTQRPVEDGGMGQNPAKDGFFLADCGRDPKVIFTYTIDGNALCSNTVYDFSAFICNVDNTSGQAPVNATLSVVGIGNNGTNTFFEIPTGDLDPGSNWQPFGRSFNSGDYTKFIVTIKNNYEGTQTTVIGNDIGVDDITFSACRPEIQIYSNNAYQPVVTVCGQGNNVPVLLEALAVYDLTEFFSTPYYHFQFKNPVGQWESAGPTDLRDNITISVDPSRYSDGMEYRVWVGATEQAVNTSVQTGVPGTGCDALTAVSDPITITYHCNCTASPAPTAQNYNDCPSTTKLDLNTLITNPGTGTYYWYTSATGGTPMSATEIQNINVSSPTSSAMNFYVSYDQDGAGEEYCEGERTHVTVSVKTVFPVNNRVIPQDLCRSWLPVEDFIYYSESPLDPSTRMHWYVIDQDGNILQDAGETVAVLSGTPIDEVPEEAKAYFTIPRDTESQFRVRVTGRSDSRCPQTADLDFYNIYDDTNFSLSGTTEVCAAAPEVTLNLTSMSGTGDLVIKKGNTVLKTETNFSGKSYTFTDDTPHGNVDEVTYTVTFGDPDFCGTEEQHTVTIGSTLDVTLTSNTPDNSNVVCDGTKVTITSNRPNTETHTWYKNGELVENVTGNVYADPDGLVDQTIYSVEVQGLCSGTGEITINVDKKPEVALNITRYNICHGDSSTVQIDYSNPSVIIPDGSTFEWKATYSNGTSAPDAYTDFETTSASGLKEHVFERAGKYTFQLEVTNGVCETVKSEKITDYIVAGEPQFSVSASETTICQNDATVLMITMASDLAQNATEKWTLNGADVLGTTTESAQGSNTIYSMEVVPTQAGSLTYKAEVTAICTASKTIDIFVEEGIEASIEQDPEMCKGGDPVHLAVDASGNYKYTWTPNNGLSSNTEKEADASPSETTTYTIIVESEARTCSAKLTTTVHVYPLPEIVSIEETGVRQITAVADNDTEWPTFRVDDIDNVYENSPVVISNVPIGYHRLYITNEYGCENSQVFEVSPIPVVPKKFFTPNDEGDPENNYWTIDGLDAYTSWIVEIYDRYGRRLYEHRTGSFSKEGNSGSEKFKWDGTYNNHQMPSDDYWYLITVEEIRKQYSGHFTLKR